nr:heptaprenyl diphosphate synthase component 1 [Bacillus suaedaesalsae]
MFKQINECIHHSYLKKYLHAPKVDEDKLTLLVAMCNELNVEEKVLHTYIITTMLVQIALDTHELVAVGSNSSDKQQKVQQLTVLAGDYFSGLYYKLLADIEDTQMIKLLAESIKLINEHKIRVYRHDLTYPEPLFDSIKIIEGQLFKNIAKTFQLLFWGEIIPEILLLKRLYKEQSELSSSGYSAISSYLLKETYEVQPNIQYSSQEIEREILEKFEEAISISNKKITNLLASQNISSTLKVEITSMIKKFVSQVHVIVEEG